MKYLYHPYLTDCANSVLLGNATAGIALSLEAAGLINCKIAIPVAVCPSVVQAVLYSGNIPVFVDIESKFLGISPDELEHVIDKVDAVIAVHAYGTICEIDRLATICHSKSKLLIEDCAQSLGATLHGVPVGSWGDVSLFSFGAGKIIDLGHGAIAISKNKELINKIRALSNGLSPFSSYMQMKINHLNHVHTKMYNTLYPGKETSAADIFRTLSMQSRDSYMYKCADFFEGKMLNEIESLKENLQHRSQNAKLFCEAFSEFDFNVMNNFEQSVIWRLNVLINQDRNKLFKYLLSLNLRISSWYPCVNTFFYKDSHAESYPVANAIGNQILNIWVDKSCDAFYVNRVIHSIKNYYGK